MVIPRCDYLGDGARVIGVANAYPQCGLHVSGKASRVSSEYQENGGPKPHSGIHDSNESQEANHSGRVRNSPSAAKLLKREYVIAHQIHFSHYKIFAAN